MTENDDKSLGKQQGIDSQARGNRLEGTEKQNNRFVLHPRIPFAVLQVLSIMTTSIRFSNTLTVLSRVFPARAVDSWSLDLGGWSGGLVWRNWGKMTTSVRAGSG